MTSRQISRRKKISRSVCFWTKGLLHWVKDLCLNSSSAINLLSKCWFKAEYLPDTTVITGYTAVSKKVTNLVDFWGYENSQTGVPGQFSQVSVRSWSLLRSWSQGLRAGHGTYLRFSLSLWPVSPTPGSSSLCSLSKKTDKVSLFK